MATSLIDADSLLAIDVGSIHTRAALFDVVDGRYRYLASGTAPSTAAAPFTDISEGMHQAIGQLQAVTGRRLMGDDERLIVPSSADGSGVDMVAATMSAGQPLSVVVVGLLEDVSLESARRLAATTYSQVIETINMNDRRKTEERIDLLLRLRPDVMIIAGGTDGGASRSVNRLVEAVGLASYLLPRDNKPELLYCGNQELADEVMASLSSIAPTQVAENIRQGLETEQLEAAQYALVGISRKIRTRQISGVKELDGWAGGGLLPTASAFGRVVQYLSKIYDSSKGVLGVDVGASAVSIATSFSGKLYQSVYPQYGMGLGLLDSNIDPLSAEVKRWLHIPALADGIRNFLYNKSLYPASIPMTPEELVIEQALARVMMQFSWKKSIAGLPAHRLHYGMALLPWFEPMIVSGSVLTRAPNLAQSLLMVLDGMQPTGITTIGLDQNHLLPMLGAAAAINPLLTVQVLESNCLLNLGTVIVPVGDARPGTVVMRLRLKYEQGEEASMDIKQGALEIIPLPAGQNAELQIFPDSKIDVGSGVPGRQRRLRVVGGALGIIIDARGRPLRLPDDPVHRMELISKWRWMVGC